MSQLVFRKIKEFFYICNYYFRENYYEWKYRNVPRKVLADYDHFLKTYSPIFVLSTGRCGTKLLTIMLSRNKRHAVYHSDYLVPNPLLKLCQNKVYQLRHHENMADMFEIVRGELIYRTYRTQRQYIETNPRATFFAYGIKTLFPNAKFIHLIRNPAKYVISLLRRNVFIDKDLEDIGLIKNPRQWAEDKSRIEKIAWIWNETHLFIEEFKKHYPHDVHTLHSEDLFKKAAASERLLEFIGDKSMTRSHIEKLISRPVNQQISGEFVPYDEWSQEDKDNLKDVAFLYQQYQYKL